MGLPITRASDLAGGKDRQTVGCRVVTPAADPSQHLGGYLHFFFNQCFSKEPYLLSFFFFLEYHIPGLYLLHTDDPHSGI